MGILHRATRAVRITTQGSVLILPPSKMFSTQNLCIFNCGIFRFYWS